MFIEITIVGFIIFLVLLFVIANAITNKKHATSNPFQALDENEIRFNGGERCDMKIGPCSCGAWHYNDEYSNIDPEIF